MAKWYLKKFIEKNMRKILIGAFLALVGYGAINAIGSQPEAANVSNTSSFVSVDDASTPIQTALTTPAPTQAGSSNLSNNSYYVNSAGSEVHSPAYSDSVPAGATARCGDGTYSFSQNRSGTCSHHGGVATWL